MLIHRSEPHNIALTIIIVADVAMGRKRMSVKVLRHVVRELYPRPGSGSTTGECTVQYRKYVWFKSHPLPTKRTVGCNVRNGQSSQAYPAVQPPSIE